MRILTKEGFRPLKEATSALLNTGLFKDYKHEGTKNKRIRYTLATGETLTTSQPIQGISFTEGEIKNDLEYKKEYAVDDYLFTPFLSVSYYPPVSYLSLSEYLSPTAPRDRNRIFYIQKTLHRACENFTVLDLIRHLAGKQKNEEVATFLKETPITLEQILSKNIAYIPTEVSKNARLVHFLVLSLIKGEIEEEQIGDVCIKSLSYNLTKEETDQMVLFLRGIEVEYSLQENSPENSLSFICEPLVSLVQAFEKEHYKLLDKFSTVTAKYFIKELFKYGEFPCSEEGYYTLKQYAYYSNLALGYANGKAFLLKEDSLKELELGDVIYLEEGYLTRICKVERVWDYEDIENNVRGVP